MILTHFDDDHINGVEHLLARMGAETLTIPKAEGGAALDRLLELAERQHLDVEKIYKEIVSGETIASRPEMRRLLEEVEKYACLQDKIQHLRSQKISAYDLIDLLENAVFMNEEYDAYYEQLSLEEIAVLLKLLHPAGGNFHEAWKLDDADLREIEQEQEWQYRFINHIRQRSQKEREKLCELLNKLRIRS